MFDRISHELLYDCSREALIKFLSAKGYDTNNLTDEAISFLFVNRLPLYVFARENGVHNKPVTKFSPDEEKLPHRDSCKEHPYFDRDGYGYVLYEGKSKTTSIECIVRGLSNIRGLNSDDVARSKMYFSFKGCNDDTYFYIYEYEYEYEYE